MAAHVWLFRCSLSVDMLAAAWLITRYGGKDAEVRFARRDPGHDSAAEHDRSLFDQDAWRTGGVETRFEAALGRLGLADDPALRKLAAVVRDSDHRGEASSPLAIALTALVQGWDLLPAPPGEDPAEGRARQSLAFALPVFDALLATFANMLSGPSH